MTQGDPREVKPMASGGTPSGLSRRSFLKSAVIGSIAGIGAFSGYTGYLIYSALTTPLSYEGLWKKSWEFDYGVVGYEIVKAEGWGPSELGFDHDIRDSPPEERILNVAQWYDYWPGKVVESFGTWMQEKWGVTGVEVRWTSNIYTSNEELFTWISQTGRKFDVMFPTNYTVESMEKAGYIVNLNRDWIPSYVNTFGRVPSPVLPSRPDFLYQTDYPIFPNGYNNAAGADFRDPALNGYAYRMNRDTYPNPRETDNFTWDEQNSLLAVPYQWGTTGIGYRTDVFDQADIEALGWDVFELTSYTNPTTGQVWNLDKKMMMLDDAREVFTAALKAVGWKRQVASGIILTAIPHNPLAPWSGEYQWSSNEVADDKLQAAVDWINSFKSSLWGFNTVQQGPWLVNDMLYLDQAWSGDVMYAIRPNSNQHLPVGYFVPKQGSTRWVDNAVIHRESEKLWLAHQFINYIHDPVVQADISSWNLYATPNAWSFEILHNNPAYSFRGRNLDGSPYYWNPAEDYRIYADFALDGPSDIGRLYTAQGRPPILERCEYQKDLGTTGNQKYLEYWRQVKFSDKRLNI